MMIADKEEIKTNFKKESTSVKEDNITFFRKYNIPMMELNTIDPLVDQIKRIFGRA